MRGQDKKWFFAVSVVCALVLSPGSLFAARVYFESGRPAHTSSSELRYVDVMLDTEGVPVNAVSLEVEFDDEALSFVSSQHDDSIVTSWFVAPQVNGNHVVLSGIMAGGFDAVIDPVSKELLPGRIARLMFSSQKEVETVLSFTEASLALHDGQGTPEIPKTESIRLLSGSDVPPSDTLPVDTDPPEVFIPMVGKDAALFDGKYFLVFETKDRGSGVAYYEVKEGRGVWQRAVSPYEIQDQTLRKQLFVKAVDVEGNVLTVKTFERDLYLTWVAIVIGGGALLGIVFLRVLKKRMNPTILHQ